MLQGRRYIWWNALRVGMFFMLVREIAICDNTDTNYYPAYRVGHETGERT